MITELQQEPATLPDGVRLFLGDCREVMAAMEPDSVDAIVTDPPYGLEFMGKEWDKLGWQSGGGFSKPGIGLRPTEWVSFSSTSRLGATNPTCGKCGGRLRGKKKCECDVPEWKPIGKRRDPRNEGLPDDMTGGVMEGQLHAMQSWHYAWAVAALRVLKPGGYLVAFGGTRTHHRLWCALEDAGFEVRDTLMWVYGQGFPKSLDVSKAIDKAAGAEREVVGENPNHRGESQYRNPFTAKLGQDGTLTAPATDAARQWDGFGTALKPSHEPIVLARKPLSESTIAANVLRWGAGAINIDGCRIGTTKAKPASPCKTSGYRPGDEPVPIPRREDTSGWNTNIGRWPANVVLECTCEETREGRVDSGGGMSFKESSLLGNQAGRPKPSNYRGKERLEAMTVHTDPDCPCAMLDAQSGEGTTGTKLASHHRGPKFKNTYNIGSGTDTHRDWVGDSGGASRFFYCAKASRAERNGSKHPTVKPLALMKWLVTLVTPPDGLVLDCFCGSGSTIEAAYTLGFRAIGIDTEAEYLEDAKRRLAQGVIL